MKLSSVHPATEAPESPKSPLTPAISPMEFNAAAMNKADGVGLPTYQTTPRTNRHGDN